MIIMLIILFTFIAITTYFMAFYKPVHPTKVVDLTEEYNPGLICKIAEFRTITVMIKKIVFDELHDSITLWGYWLPDTEITKENMFLYQSSSVNYSTKTELLQTYTYAEKMEVCTLHDKSSIEYMSHFEYIMDLFTERFLFTGFHKNDGDHWLVLRETLNWYNEHIGNLIEIKNNPKLWIYKTLPMNKK